ncbi:MAG TPA: phosphoribosylanthranilate isomerase, partial [Thermoanaerobaculia bacterium]|nr:phosphoribosylanthranilate isomerase [Thermoanaerobaculia bacterium]
PGSIIRLLARPAIRAVAMPSGKDRIDEASEASWTLFDGKHPGRGETFDWEIVERVPRPRRMFLAGGLTPQNVREAVARVRPDGVDVSSGVEERPGKKSVAKMRQFVDEVKQA